MTGLKVTKITRLGGEGPKLELIAIGSSDEPDWKSAEYQNGLKALATELRGTGLHVSPQMLAQRSLDGGTWLTGTYVLHLAQFTALPALGFIGGWLKARMGRKVRLKIGDIEAEATSVAEVEQLLAVANKHLAAHPTPQSDR